MRSEAERRPAKRYIAAQYQLGVILIEAENLDSAAPQVLDAIGSALHWDVGVLWTLSPPESVLRPLCIWQRYGITAREFERATMETTFEPGIGLPGRVWASGEPIWVGNVVEDDNFPRAPMAAKSGLHSALAFPLKSAGKFLGLIEFFSRSILPPDSQMLQTVATFGHQIGMFIARHRAEVALRESEARKSAILAAALDCVISIDHQGRVQEWNPAAEATFGFSRGDVIGRELADLIVPAPLREPHRSGLRRYLETGIGSVIGRRVEMPAVRADGVEIAVELTIVSIQDGATPMFTGFLRDITARRKAADNQQLLVEAGEVLSSSLDYDSTLRTLAALVVPRLADWCVIDVTEDDGKLRRIATTHSDPARQALALELDRRYPPRPDVAVGPYQVMRTHKTEYSAKIDETILRSSVIDEEHYRIIRGLGLKSYICAPLLARDDVVGIISLVQAESGRAFDEQDVLLAEELARRAGLALENSLLYGIATNEKERAEASARQVGELNARLQLAVKETHHRVKNNLQVIAALVDIQMARSPDSPERENFQRLAQHVHALASIYDMLSLHSRRAGDTESLSVPDALNRLAATLQPILDGRSIRTQIQDTRLTLEQSTSLVMLASELIMNSIKHGRGSIDLTFTVKDGVANLQICDEGPGFPKDFDPERCDSLGIELVRRLSQWDLRGDTRFENGDTSGARVTLQFPVATGV